MLRPSASKANVKEPTGLKASAWGVSATIASQMTGKGLGPEVKWRGGEPLAPWNMEVKGQFLTSVGGVGSAN